MSVHSRTMLPPGASKKRKEGEPLYSVKPVAPRAEPLYSVKPVVPKAEPLCSVKPLAPKAGDSVSSNRLLAGYLAYEFLNKGTLFGERYDPARSEAVALASSPAECKRTKLEVTPSVKKESQSYAEVASILKVDGAYLPGIVNPTQLARWIKM